MTNSIFSSAVTVENLLIMGGLALVFGVIYAYISSLRLRSSKGFFVTLSLLPLIVSLGISLLQLFLTDQTSTNVARIATVAIALGLVRFRSNNGRSEEMLLLLGSVISGLVYGLGYVFYASVAEVLFSLLFVLLISLPIFKNKKFNQEKILNITIPESLNYTDVFDSIFDKYLSSNEMVGLKTTNMGSMFRLSYRITLKDLSKEKEMIDELRIRNGNLEISLLPYVEQSKEL
jgi:hypothetical protein